MKDTIYIDVEDDITAIIGKVKSAKSKIVALVPPKRVGVLQSAVNLQLLARAAKQGNKHLVLISGNQALTALAASAGISSARTLQSKPVLAPPPEVDDNIDDDIIDGADLPIGDLAKTEAEGDTVPIAKAAPAIDSAIRANAAEEAAASPMPRAPRVKRTSIKVPNFDTFRKKLILAAGGLALLAGFLVWAIWFAPNAHIAITARTIESSANPKVTLSTSATTNAAAGTIKAIQQEVQKEAVIEFEATGEKEVGEKSKGAVVFRNCRSTDPVTIASGTGVSAGGKTYITQEPVVVPGGTASGWPPTCAPGVSDPVEVVAQEIGEDYDTDEGTQFAVSGYSSTGSTWLRANASSDIDGGSKRKIKVVTKEDVNKAADQLAAESVSDMKNQLASKFGEGIVMIDTSFKTDKSEVTSSPAVDAEVKDGKAKLGGVLIFTMLGVSESEISHFLDDYFASQIEEGENQRVYDNGAEKANFVDIASAEDGYKATMTATAKFGPKIDDAQVKQQAQGKKYGDVQSAIEAIPGVESVDVKFSPFWVRTVPKDESRITIEFNLDESE